MPFSLGAQRSLKQVGLGGIRGIQKGPNSPIPTYPCLEHILHSPLLPAGLGSLCQFTLWLWASVASYYKIGGSWP